MSNSKGENSRNTEEIKRILEKLPDLTTFEEQTLLSDLVSMRKSFNDVEAESKFSEVKLFMASKISLVDKAERIIKEKLYYDLSHRNVIEELYFPLFENEVENEPTTISLRKIYKK